jgi:hypothetical protein
MSILAITPPSRDIMYRLLNTLVDYIYLCYNLCLFPFMIFQIIAEKLKNKNGLNRMLFSKDVLNKMQNEFPDVSVVTTKNILFNFDVQSTSYSDVIPITFY